VGIVFAILVTLLIGACGALTAIAVPVWAVVTGFSVSVAVGLFFECGRR